MGGHGVLRIAPQVKFKTTDNSLLAFCSAHVQEKPGNGPRSVLPCSSFFIGPSGRQKPCRSSICLSHNIALPSMIDQHHRFVFSPVLGLDGIVPPNAINLSSYFAASLVVYTKVAVIASAAVTVCGIL